MLAFTYQQVTPSIIPYWYKWRRFTQNPRLIHPDAPCYSLMQAITLFTQYTVNTSLKVQGFTHVSTVNITQAAKLAGISRSYFHRKYLKSGQITTITDKQGHKQVQVKDLIDVFGELKGVPVHSEQVIPSTQSEYTTGKEESKLLAENEALKAKLAAIESQVEDLRDDKEWYKQQIAEEKARAIEEKLRAERAEIKLLEHLTPSQAETSEPDPGTQALLKELAQPKWWQFWK